MNPVSVDPQTHRAQKFDYFDRRCSEIFPFLYLGSNTVASSYSLLSHHQITHVINCSASVFPNYFESEFHYLSLTLTDDPTQDILSLFPFIIMAIEEVRTKYYEATSPSSSDSSSSSSSSSLLNLFGTIVTWAAPPYQLGILAMFIFFYNMLFTYFVSSWWWTQIEMKRSKCQCVQLIDITWELCLLTPSVILRIVHVRIIVDTSCMSISTRCFLYATCCPHGMCWREQS